MTAREAPCILLVEDDAETREALSRFLADEGYRVVGAARGDAGTRALKAGTVAAAILDVGLPGEVVRRLVSLGDSVTLDRTLERVGDNVIAKAMDDRTGPCGPPTG